MNLKTVNVSIVVQIKNEIATMPMLIQTKNVYNGYSLGWKNYPKRQNSNPKY